MSEIDQAFKGTKNTSAQTVSMFSVTLLLFCTGQAAVIWSGLTHQRWIRPLDQILKPGGDSYRNDSYSAGLLKSRPEKQKCFTNFETGKNSAENYKNKDFQSFQQHSSEKIY